MKDYKLYIFDWDGTLMDSVGRIVSSMQSAAKDVGLLEPTENQVKNIIGLSLSEASLGLFPTLNKSTENSLIERYKRHYLELDDTPTPLFPHVEQLLTLLTENNKLLAVATGKGREGLERVFKVSNIKHYFNASRCGDECKSKPHPEMIEQLLNELNVLPEDALMIGDSTHDLSMAKKAKVDRLGVSFGVHQHSDLKQFTPIAIVDSYHEFIDLFTQ